MSCTSRRRRHFTVAIHGLNDSICVHLAARTTYKPNPTPQNVEKFSANTRVYTVIIVLLLSYPLTVFYNRWRDTWVKELWVICQRLTQAYQRLVTTLQSVLSSNIKHANSSDVCLSAPDQFQHSDIHGHVATMHLFVGRRRRSLAL